MVELADLMEKMGESSLQSLAPDPAGNHSCSARTNSTSIKISFGDVHTKIMGLK